MEVYLRSAHTTLINSTAEIVPILITMLGQPTFIVHSDNICSALRVFYLSNPEPMEINNLSFVANCFQSNSNIYAALIVLQSMCVGRLEKTTGEQNVRAMILNNISIIQNLCLSDVEYISTAAFTLLRKAYRHTPNLPDYAQAYTHCFELVKACQANPARLPLAINLITALAIPAPAIKASQQLANVIAMSFEVITEKQCAPDFEDVPFVALRTYLLADHLTRENVHIPLLNDLLEKVFELFNTLQNPFASFEDIYYDECCQLLFATVNALIRIDKLNIQADRILDFIEAHVNDRNARAMPTYTHIICIMLIEYHNSMMGRIAFIMSLFDQMMSTNDPNTVKEAIQLYGDLFHHYDPSDPIDLQEPVTRIYQYILSNPDSIIEQVIPNFLISMGQVIYFTKRGIPQPLFDKYYQILTSQLNLTIDESPILDVKATIARNSAIFSGLQSIFASMEPLPREGIRQTNAFHFVRSSLRPLITKISETNAYDKGTLMVITKALAAIVAHIGPACVSLIMSGPFTAMLKGPRAEKFGTETQDMINSFIKWVERYS